MQIQYDTVRESRARAREEPMQRQSRSSLEGQFREGSCHFKEIWAVRGIGSRDLSCLRACYFVFIVCLVFELVCVRVCRESGLANIDPFTAYSALDSAACGFSLTTTWGGSWGLLNVRGDLDLSWVLNVLRVSLCFSASVKRFKGCNTDRLYPTSTSRDQPFQRCLELLTCTAPYMYMLLSSSPMQMMMAEKRSPYKENSGAEAREERAMSHVPGLVQLIGLRDRVQGTRD